ncbi:MAG TPA: ABC transporter permease [Elusimicrobiota bacterium]|nr:ABC transporter permease [Elusimicrobiota bacterium]
MNFLLAVASLWEREMKRFFRDRARVVGAIAPPVLFWFLIGSGLGPKVLQYYFSGTLVLIVLFTAVFATISIIDDRKEGFLQSVLVSPAPRLAVVMGKVLGAATVGFVEGLCFLVFARAVGLPAGLMDYLWAVLVLALCALGLTGIGFCIAWSMESTQGFHAVMNLFLIPLWMLSGALFPAATAPVWLRWVMRVNPVTYAVVGLQEALSPMRAGGAAFASLSSCLIVLAGFSAAILAFSAWLAGTAAAG